MIRYLSDEEKQRSRILYREAFPEDTDAFVEYYYHYVTKDNRILVREEDGRICSMLHLNPYRISVNGQVTDAYYYVAVATAGDCRHQGMMQSLLEKSLRDICSLGHPFAYLMPVNRAIYEPFGFRIVYEQKKTELPEDPVQANEKMSGMFDVYTVRDDSYMEKMREEERVCEGDAPFDIIPYIMMRITNVERMLGFLRSCRPHQVTFCVKDRIIPENQGIYEWKISETESICRKTEKQKDAEFSIDIAELTEFVFGKRKILRLKDVFVLKKIFINESV